MFNAYYKYLQSLDKKDLIKIIYQHRKPSKPFPYFSMRNIAIRLSYDGRNYSGVQHHDFIRSIEGELRNSLELSGIGEDPVFCGRTDGGVSAISMIVSLRVKSRNSNPNRSYILQQDDYSEYPYDKIINERLPDDIRVTDWAPVPDDFNARHSCIQRSYKYYFILKDMDLKRIQVAAQRILEMRNFYKLSTHSNPKAVYDRKIDSLEIIKEDDNLSNKLFRILEENSGKILEENSGKILEENSGKISNNLTCINNDSLNTNIAISNTSNSNANNGGLYSFNIKAGSFLHNMVRKIAWVILEYGKGNEFILENVRIAPAFPLIFMDAKYKNELNFIGNRFTKPLFEQKADEEFIMAKIAKMRYDKYS